MIGYLDPILFPDDCQVYLMSNGSCVYPIFKNGSSSLRKDAKLLTTAELTSVETVDVFLRHPLERYVSGVQTYLKFSGETIDKETMLTVIDEFLFLNRHFALQFHWLMNLSRFSDSSIRIRHVDDISTVTDNRMHVSSKDTQLFERFSNNNRLQYYLLLDKILYEDLMGKTMTFPQIVEYVKVNYPDLYTDTILRSKNICSVLG